PAAPDPASPSVPTTRRRDISRPADQSRPGAPGHPGLPPDRTGRGAGWLRAALPAAGRSTTWWAAVLTAFLHRHSGPEECAPPTPDGCRRCPARPADTLDGVLAALADTEVEEEAVSGARGVTVGVLTPDTLARAADGGPDLSVVVGDDRVELRADSRLWLSVSVERIAGHLATFAAAAPGAPDTPIAELP